MAWVGIGVLVLAGVIALVLSVREDKRAQAPREETAEAPARDEMAGSEPAAEAEPAPEVDRTPEAEPVVVPAALETEPAVDDAAVRARIAALAAELNAPSEVAREPAPETSRETTAQEAERVFASVAAVGRATPEREEGAALELVHRVTEEATGQAEAGETSGVGHEHERPIANHSDLLAHVRREHTDISTTGSTIQIRILHERAHAAQPTDA